MAPLAAEAAAERLGFVTLEQFLQKLPPELKILHDGGNGAGPLRWVEPSELEDPTPYLLDGEFILTAGLPFLGDGGTGGQHQCGGGDKSLFHVKFPLVSLMPKPALPPWVCCLFPLSEPAMQRNRAPPVALADSVMHKGHTFA